VKEVIDKRKLEVFNDPKIKAAREKAEELLPDPLAPNEPLNPLLRGFHKARKAVDVDDYDNGSIKSGI